MTKRSPGEDDDRRGHHDPGRSHLVAAGFRIGDGVKNNTGRPAIGEPGGPRKGSVPLPYRSYRQENVWPARKTTRAADERHLRRPAPRKTTREAYAMPGGTRPKKRRGPSERRGVPAARSFGRYAKPYFTLGGMQTDDPETAGVLAPRSRKRGGFRWFCSGGV